MLARLFAVTCLVFAGLTPSAATTPVAPDVPPAHRHVGPVAWKDVGLSLEAACGLGRDGSAWCWGDAVSYSKPDANLPVRVPGTWRELTQGFYVDCGVKKDRSGWCWGNGQVPSSGV
ncbi:MAG TPA: hypothetical protein VFW27_26745 [Actinoplanes sp.]|nr:hypothetical protein [Actinoplanes sp.]